MITIAADTKTNTIVCETLTLKLSSELKKISELLGDSGFALDNDVGELLDNGLNTFNSFARSLRQVTSQLKREDKLNERLSSDLHGYLSGVAFTISTIEYILKDSKLSNPEIKAISRVKVLTGAIFEEFSELQFGK